MGIGRGRAICEFDEFICKSLPGASDDAEFIDTTREACNRVHKPGAD